jgi:signal transduction histidine kinase
MGIMGMEERARVMNAAFNIESEKNKGTTIHLKIPIKQKNDKDTTG